GLQATLTGDCVLRYGDARHRLLRAAGLAAAVAAGLVIAALAAGRRSGRTLIAAASTGVAARTLRAIAVQLGLRRRHESLQITFLELLPGQTFDGLEQLL